MVTIKSSIQECVPIKSITFTSFIVPDVVIFNVEVTIEALLLGMVTGTFVLIAVIQLLVVKELLDEKLPEPH